MSVQSAATLKGYFETGDVPTAAQFGDLVDSTISNAIDARIYLPSSYVTDGSVDYTTQIQSAITAAAAAKTPLSVPAGTFKGNWTLPSDLTLFGTGMQSTKFIPAADDAVFKTSLTTSVVRVVLRDFGIDGTATKATYTSQDGIRLKQTTASTWTDTVVIENVRVDDCGQYGIHLYGDTTSGPFVQRLTLRNVHVFDCAKAGLYGYGQIMEAGAYGCSFIQNGDGSNENVLFEATGAGAGIRRFLFAQCLFNHLSYPTTGTAFRAYHAQQLAFRSCDFESANYMLSLSGALTRAITVSGSNFESASDVTAAVLLADAHGVVIKGNTFNCTPGTMTAAVSSGASATSRVTRLDIGENVYLNNVTRAVNVADNVTIATGKIYAYQSLMRVATEAAAATDDLDYIYGPSGTDVTTGLSHGQVVTLRASDGTKDVVVKHGTGNIQLFGAVDVTLDENWKTVTLVWDANLAKWIGK